MKKILIGLAFLIASLFTSQVFALSEKDITFPVAELGGCKDEAECRAFCDIPANKMSPCFPFAKKYNLVTQEEIDRGERFNDIATTGGPGWCRVDEGCSVEMFCNDYANLDQCLDFAEENGFATADELVKARKVAEGMKKENAILPPGDCRGENECEIYCSVEGNWQECIKWEEQIGIHLELSPEAEKFVNLILSGKAAGGCKTKTECENYCSDPGHSQECVDMAVAVGFITEEEAEIARQYGSTGPGGCKTEQECSAFCQQPYNQKVCLAYTSEHSIEVDFKGPGGCGDSGSCSTYCTDNPSDPECKKYSSKYQGFKGPGGCEDENSCKAYCQANPADSECKQYSGQYGGFSGPGGCSDVGSCTAYCKENSQDAECQKYSSQYGGGFSGPGGCNSEASCKTYCQANSQDAACTQMASQYGGFSGPGGCTSVDGCKAYCQSNPADSTCQQYMGEYGGFKGPGGCTDQASCRAYCQSNPKDEACAPYVGQYGGQYQQQSIPPAVRGASTSFLDNFNLKERIEELVRGRSDEAVEEPKKTSIWQQILEFLQKFSIKLTPKPSPLPSPFRNPFPASTPTSTKEPQLPPERPLVPQSDGEPISKAAVSGQWRGRYDTTSPSECGDEDGGWEANLQENNGRVSGSFSSDMGISGSVSGSSSGNQLSWDVSGSGGVSFKGTISGNTVNGGFAGPVCDEELAPQPTRGSFFGGRIVN